MYAAVLEQIRMEKRLKASAAGLQELQLLREKHQQEIQHLLSSLRSQANTDYSSTHDVPPPLPPRVPITQSQLRTSATSSDFNTTSKTRPASERLVDRQSTFRRPRKMSETTYTYPSPMHAILMQYPKSDTKVISDNDNSVSNNDKGYLETTFPADEVEPISNHCEKCLNKNCKIHRDTKGHRLCLNDTGIMNTDSVEWDQNFIQQFLQNTNNSSNQNINEEELISPNKSHSRRNSHSLSALSEDGYFSCSDQSVSRQSVASYISNDSLLDPEPNDKQWFVVKNDSEQKIYWFSNDIHNEEHVFV